MHSGAHENQRFDYLRWNPRPSSCLCGIANVYSYHYRIIRQGIVGQFWLWVFLILCVFSIGLRLRYTQKKTNIRVLPMVCHILHILAPTYWAKGFPSGSAGKESTCNAGDKGDAGSIPGSGWSPGGENGSPPPDSCLENPMDRGVGLYTKGSRRVKQDWGTKHACSGPIQSCNSLPLLQTHGHPCHSSLYACTHAFTSIFPFAQKPLLF